MLESAFLDRDSVDECSVAAFEIADLVASPSRRDAMAARQGRITDGKQIGRISSDRNFLPGKNKMESFKGPEYDQESGIQCSPSWSALVYHTSSVMQRFACLLSEQIGRYPFG